MNFYVPCEAIRYLEDQEFEWLNPADFSSQKECITLYEYSNGWIIKADDSFNSFFTILTGHQLPHITDQEYRQYILDKKAFLGKARTRSIIDAWSVFREKKR